MLFFLLSMIVVGWYLNNRINELSEVTISTHSRRLAQIYLIATPLQLLYNSYILFYGYNRLLAPILGAHSLDYGCFAVIGLIILSLYS